MSQSPLTPSELRAMFGENLRKLSAPYGSISDLSRKLGINRTQYNRYLAGESFPRPDVLARVCRFFKVDARVLLDPVEKINDQPDPIANPFLQDFLGVGSAHVSEDTFPSGFYRFTRRSFIDHDRFIMSLVLIKRDGPHTFMRGYETVQAMQSQNIPSTAPTREFRGIIMRQDDGVAILTSRKNSLTCSFSYLARVASFENNYWVGYATRTVAEAAEGIRATRMVFEHIGTKPSDALPMARKIGLRSAEKLPPFHRRLLMTDDSFS